MLAVRLAVAAVLTLAVAPAAHGDAQATAPPSGVKAFLRTVAEPPGHAFPRTPAFAWNPVKGALRYEFELAKSSDFNEGSVFWSSASIKTPVVAPPVALPWLTGKPYGVYAHVRAVTAKGATAWSAEYGFNVKASETPTKELQQFPGMVRWTRVDGATSYDVWFTDIPKMIRTKTNVADEREYYDFHQVIGIYGSVHWRVRAVRHLYGNIPTGLPAVSYGPWSEEFTNVNPPLSLTPLSTVAAVSDTISTPDAPTAHRLTPGVAFNGTLSAGYVPYELYRPYLFSDDDCVNVVFRGAIVGSPAYAPRSSTFTDLPHTESALNAARTGWLLKGGSEGEAFMADTSRVAATELDPPPPPPTDGTGSANGAPTQTPGDPESQVPPAIPGSGVPQSPKVSGAPVDLWDSGWPNGRFYWTVVPVKIVFAPIGTTSLSIAASAGATTLHVRGTEGFNPGIMIDLGEGATYEEVGVLAVTATALILAGPLKYSHGANEEVHGQSTNVQYHEVELPQDACQRHARISSFGKTSAPSLAAGSTPYVSGLSPSGRLIPAAGAKPAFYGAPLVAWEPALGADEYQVQWSRTRYPWNPTDPATGKPRQKLTYGTSTMLPLTPGTWYYRVRGIDFFLPGTARAMSWSQTVAVVIAKPKFRVVPSR
ncbi:MAG: hypothetical protein M3540_00590 [Actinomycetota bacterium]|nr:hypothetical protein [Actinomycetota bacterium]